MKRLLLFAFAFTLAFAAMAQPPANYYNSANGLTGQQLKVALHNIVKGHTTISYSQIWNAFWSTDNKGNGVVWDMYSDRPGGTPPYTYRLGQDQCGQYDSEGDCYNREHSWPQSWFNNDATAKTDLHHIFATDGYVNQKRGNFPFGEVRSASWTSQNGSKLGTSMTAGYTGTVFEPIDEYKGDFARALMYMSVRYYGEDSNWSNSEMTDKSVIKPWAITMLLRWNEQDPVSQKEINRNNAIYNDYQYNRNPFVDHPEYANMIWDPTWSVPADELETTIAVYPNPVQRGGEIHVDLRQQKVDRMAISDISGKVLFVVELNAGEKNIVVLSEKLQSGFYFLQFRNGGQVVMNKKLLII